MENNTLPFLKFLKSQYYVKIYLDILNISSVGEAEIYIRKIDKKLVKKVLKDGQYIVLYQNELSMVMMSKSSGVLYLERNLREPLYF